MLKSIHLENFQIHKDSGFELSPGINVFIGDSDQGKSSIARALYWLFFNRPSGQDFIKEGAKSCSVTAKTDNHKIQRIRNKKRNSYKIDNSFFDATRTDVPQEVKQIVPFNSTNIQMQFDPPFLLSLNSSDVAKKLNNMTGLDQIDSSLKYINSVIRKQSSEEKHLNQEIKTKDQQLKVYAPLKEVEELHAQYEKHQEELEALDNKLKEIDTLIAKLDSMVTLLNIQSKIDNVGELFEKFDEILIDVDTEKTKHKEISRTEKTLSNIKSKIDVYSKNQKQLEKLMNDFDKEAVSLKDLRLEQEKIKKTIERLSKTEKKLTKTKKAFEKIERDFGKMKSKLEVCPLCERPFEECEETA